MSDLNEGPMREKRSFIMARDPSVDRRFRPRPHKQLRLFDDIHESTESTDGSDTESEYASNAGDDATSVDDSSEVDTGPQVFLRLRPVSVASTGYSLSEDGKCLITSAKSENSSNNVNRMEKHFGFTSIFDGSVGQRDIYDMCVGPRILEEECVTIMTYGTSGSGKTYTLLGDQLRAGVIPRGLEHIFTIYLGNLYSTPKLKLINGCIVFLQDDATLREMQISMKLLNLCPDINAQHERLRQEIRSDHTFETKTEPDLSVMIWVSFVEIYNELVYDLLSIPPRQDNLGAVQRKPLKIACNKGQVFIKGLTTVFVKSSEEALRLLRLGQQRSTYASTSVNSNSSRSHCVFTVDVLKYSRSGMTTQCSYKFCDLAGSERVNNTGTIGLRLKEAKNINTSLMTLGRCLDAASTSRKKSSTDVIPFRDSKLTMLLQAALLGKERLAMIVTVTPLEKYYEENLNVLNFASIAKNIVFKEPMIKQHSTRYSGFFDNPKADGQYDYIKALEEDNISLREEIDRLKFDHVLKMQLLEERLRKELTDTFQEMIRVNKKQWEEQSEKQKLMAEREFEFKLDSQKRIYEEQIEDLKDEIDYLKNPASETSIESMDEIEDDPIEIHDDE
ncbi:kinesin-like protein subito [Drosophila guanche]|uniref:Blast:Kinesin-like protein subito n=2 Tax=Drosophila guanche TaxID=7266 RepID=A0A3B0J1N7_DROGU|nr:kinesin-like protein subito [Drosophila guanche]SPP74887.1 blast:Kinesin-like protein subito [Drosophila guanche]